jgi:hypothetical protein
MMLKSEVQTLSKNSKLLGPDTANVLIINAEAVAEIRMRQPYH